MTLENGWIESTMVRYANRTLSWNYDTGKPTAGFPRPMYEDIVRQDSSISLRQGVRAGWQAGEHLWDADMNLNFVFMNRWSAMVNEFYREPWGIWPLPTPNYSYVKRDGNHATYFKGATVDTEVYPYTGAKAYIKADYLNVGFNGSEWKAFCETPIWKPRMEIAFYASALSPSEEVSYTATEAFWLPSGHLHFSHARNIVDHGRHYSPRGERPVRKNGQQIGVAFSDLELPSSGIILDEEQTFNAGDVLSVDGPMRDVAISFFGKRL
ncbi:hypothetical protein [Amorphus orientalis]|uniref:Uncharacterized protein n=1 Tax=Amorphus orientalis TaxID=649198 RepID=A0AAE3VTA3_9HYPH|nr:hypothetical protein [Amorphus orientalis]MDQ0317731.1 hypothetical protein [Amorphus orientalis]